MIGETPEIGPISPEETPEREAREKIEAAVKELRVGLELEKHPEIRDRLAELGPHFDDSVEMAKMGRVLYGQLREKFGLRDEKPERLMRAALLHDVGKSGPPGKESPMRDAVRRLFHPLARPFIAFANGRMKTIRDFVDEAGLEHGEDILATLERNGVDPDQEPIVEFWRRHAGWTYDLLKTQTGPDIDEDIVKVAASHHLLEGKDPAHLGVDGPVAGSAAETVKLAEILAAVDKYQALRSRGGLGHAEAVARLERMINARFDLLEPLRQNFLTATDVIARSGDKLSEIIDGKGLDAAG